VTDGLCFVPEGLKKLKLINHQKIVNEKKVREKLFGQATIGAGFFVTFLFFFWSECRIISSAPDRLRLALRRNSSRFC